MIHEVSGRIHCQGLESRQSVRCVAATPAAEYTAKDWNQGKAKLADMKGLEQEYTAKDWNQGKASRLWCRRCQQEYTAKDWNQGKA